MRIPCTQAHTFFRLDARGQSDAKIRENSALLGALIGFPLRKAGRQSHLGETGDVIDAQLFHERLTITTDGLLAQLQQGRDILAGFDDAGDQPQDLVLAGRELFHWLPGRS